MYRKTLMTIKKASMGDGGIYYDYNYFEDDGWECAGFNTEKYQIASQKIGWEYFNRAVVAAYVLEGLYLDGPSAAMVDAELVTSQSFIGWINYLFHEHFPLKNRDPWKLFEAMHNDSDKEQEELSEYNWEDFVYDIYGAIGYFEIKSVLEGTDAVIMDVINES